MAGRARVRAAARAPRARVAGLDGTLSIATVARHLVKIRVRVRVRVMVKIRARLGQGSGLGEKARVRARSQG